MAIKKIKLPTKNSLPVSLRDRAVMLDELYHAIYRIKNQDLQTLVVHIVADNENNLRDCPAACTKHQPYLGGLLEHILNIIGMVDGVCATYNVLNRDLLVAAAILHDIGKIEELHYDTSIGYTRRGRLIGHIALSLYIFHDALKICPLNQDLADHLEHIIASHHGLLEWGAIRVPMSREATIFHLLDNIEARMGVIDTMIGNQFDIDGFTEKNSTFGSSLFQVSEF